MSIQEIRGKISTIKSFWTSRNDRFKDWYEILTLIDLLKTRGMETYVSNDPQTFYNMAHYLLTKGHIQHDVPVESESAVDYDRKALVHRSCDYMWHLIDHDRQLGGSQPFIDELAFYLLVLGWYSTVFAYESETGLLQAQIWNPADTFPLYADNRMTACIHSYPISAEEAEYKASENNWAWENKKKISGYVQLDDFFHYIDGKLMNIILIDGDAVTEWTERSDMRIMVAPVGGFPDKGSLLRQGIRTQDWRKLVGRGIFEVNQPVTVAMNKWKSVVSQILRDTAQPVTQEFSASPQATPEQIRERGALFHYAPGEQGLNRLQAATVPIELQAMMLELRREGQKGSFNDAVYGMVEGQPGYALSLLASSSANQILYPYMDGKHFVISEADSFWLRNLKSSGRVFNVKGKFIEKLKPTDIPEDVAVNVESEVATPKDWMERGTIGGMLRQDLDKTTLLSEIYKFNDPQSIIRSKNLDMVLDHPMSQEIRMIAGYYSHADYLMSSGDARQASLFRNAAQALESKFGAPAPGQGSSTEATRVAAEREAGAPAEEPTVPSSVSPPENQGFTPEQLRRSTGNGTIRTL